MLKIDFSMKNKNNTCIVRVHGKGLKDESRYISRHHYFNVCMGILLKDIITMNLKPEQKMSLTLNTVGTIKKYNFCIYF